MTINDVREQILHGEDYNFIYTNEHTRASYIMLTIGGSWAYGLNNPNSDIDCRGIALNSKSDLLGFTSFDQLVDNTTDTTIYGFNKFVKLALNCNPNIIEMLFNRPDFYFYLSKTGQKLLKNKMLFLSRKAANSFSGYALAQTLRLTNAVAHDAFSQPEEEEHILNAIQRSMLSFPERYCELPTDGIKLYIDDSTKDDMDTEIFMDINLSHYPVRDYKGMWAEMNEVTKQYKKLGKRNHKKDLEHLNKHMSHLVRLYIMGAEILSGDCHTYRTDDRQLLLDIKTGKYMGADNKPIPEFYEMVEFYKKEFKYAEDNSPLPENPDIKKIEEFVMDVNEKVVKGEMTHD